MIGYDREFVQNQTMRRIGRRDVSDDYVAVWILEGIGLVRFGIFARGFLRQ